jgi:hypothetical protein
VVVVVRLPYSDWRKYCPFHDKMNHESQTVDLLIMLVGILADSDDDYDFAYDTIGRKQLLERLRKKIQGLFTMSNFRLGYEHLLTVKRVQRYLWTARATL